MSICCTVEPLNEKILVSPRTGFEYKFYEIEPEYIMAIDVHNGEKLITGWCGSLYGDLEDKDDYLFIENYENKLYGYIKMEKRILETLNDYLTSNRDTLTEKQKKNIREEMVWLTERI